MYMGITRPGYFIPGIHIFIWTLLLAVPAIIFHNVPGNTGLPPGFFPVTNIYHIGLFYGNAYFLYPRLFTKKRWWIYVLVLGAIVVISGYAKLFILRWTDPTFPLNSFNSRIIFFPTAAFLIVSIIYRFIIDRVQFEKLEKERKAERLISELKFLRSQVSPHFLFNMMTNMVSLARQNSALLEPSLIKLSDLLRYMLYEPGEEKFPVSKEADYLKNYIELQQLRFGEGVNIQLDINDNFDDFSIEPMLLLPFAENAFKHGIGLVKDPFIRISLRVQDRNLVFNASNNYNKKNLSKDKNSGIGLANVRNRLQLLYPEKFRLAIQDNGEIYCVELNINLS